MERIVYRPGTGTYEEKRSRFIGELYPSSSVEEALSHAEDAKKRMYDAKHHCFAYILHDGSMRAADDGEPQGTAGRPILDAMQGHDLTDAVLVVTRYFGGTLLGTGGLVRAYGKAAEAAIADAGIAEKEKGILITLRYPYGDDGRIGQLLRNADAMIQSVDYTEEIRTEAVIPELQAGAFLSRLTEVSAGRLSPEKKEEVAFRRDGKKAVLLRRPE